MNSYENKPGESENSSGVLNGDPEAGSGTRATSTSTTSESEPHVQTNPSEATSAATIDNLEASGSGDEEVHVAYTEFTQPWQQARRGWHWPAQEELWPLLAFWGVILLGAILRFWGLGDKPLHHDESLHAYFSLQLMHNLESWSACLNAPVGTCYRYDPLLHGPFQFHAIAFVYKLSQLLGAPDNGVNTTTVRIAAATLGTVIVGLPYFLRDYLGKIGAWLACFLLAISPSMVYFSRFAREDIYMACFTLLLIVSVGRYVHTRRSYWLTLAAVGFILSYATKEATFLSIAVFGSFFVAVLLWEIGVIWRVPQRPLEGREASWLQRHLVPRTTAPFILLAYFVLLGLLAKWFFGWLKDLSLFITANPKNTASADLYVHNLKYWTVQIFPWVGILLAGIVLTFLVLEQYGKMPDVRKNRWVARLDARKQPLLETIVTMPWTHWFFAFMAAITIYLVLFTVIFTNISGGIGDGIWQGLYYWVQQQQVARGGQPWYYYLLLIPLYEQIGLVFGLAGVVRCLIQPSRFRLFLVYWFVGNVFIYSWAGEKMPWLMIHMTMPMMVLAAIALEPIVVRIVAFFTGRASRQAVLAPSFVPETPPVSARREGWWSLGWSVFGAICALLLLLPTLQNMFQVNYVHYADAPYEMMIYVQSTKDVNTVMAKIDALDQKLYGGKHLLPIGVTDDATWPFAWYVRDYTNVCFKFPSGCASNANGVAVIISGGDSYPGTIQSYGKSYAYKAYRMRAQWDQGYMPTRCVPAPKQTCELQQYTGSGPLLWLSYGDKYGDTPPKNVSFNLPLAVNNVWQWWWYRKPFGSVDGYYGMGLFIRRDLNAAP
ncbi:flippase activity-associated protein Agl23 [Tengunoibacter tsumagoiensis]|uniref:Glycosyltransferase RgtA/B/C/D-like domain-containing protein n=1 Tax=Tengunoibacter tsumagoiensis TaxID=2014871 RepID=A0A401ZXU4_9CHLR|nr:flippase activity-associated protein Agl23 [Tengunoibacter tsumagoiensis]GCE11688.1 hypothetical protein KTT_15470 [Tengunoibacter tsumagoiensis]